MIRLYRFAYSTNVERVTLALEHKGLPYESVRVDPGDRFESMLDGRPYLMGDEFSAADLCTWPFLKYGLLGLESDDDDPLHAVLAEHLAMERHQRRAEWVSRIGERA